ncbi:MAG TPA: DUF4232 domain-containing protein [Acidimicrobiales bacterium]|nr:DUF4232 domain-containing protein [Acidimicrobiales bacterium]
MRRAPLATAGLIAIAVAAGGCGGSGHPATAPTTATSAAVATTAPTTGTATTAPTSVPVTTVTTAAASTTTVAPVTTSTTSSDRCTHLAIAVGQSEGAAGTIGVPLSFTNTGSTTCVLGGYPGVALLDASGAQAVQAARTGSPGSPVRLAPGAEASALLTGSDVPSGSATSCPSYPAALVTPPGSTSSEHVSLTADGGKGLPGCSTPQIRPVVAGSGG